MEEASSGTSCCSVLCRGLWLSVGMVFVLICSWLSATYGRESLPALLAPTCSPSCGDRGLCVAGGVANATAGGGVVKPGVCACDLYRSGAACETLWMGAEKDGFSESAAVGCVIGLLALYAISMAITANQLLAKGEFMERPTPVRRLRTVCLATAFTALASRAAFIVVAFLAARGGERSLLVLDRFIFAASSVFFMSSFLLIVMVWSELIRERLSKPTLGVQAKAAALSAHQVQTTRRVTGAAILFYALTCMALRGADAMRASSSALLASNFINIGFMVSLCALAVQWGGKYGSTLAQGHGMPAGAEKASTEDTCAELCLLSFLGSRQKNWTRGRLQKGEVQFWLNFSRFLILQCFAALLYACVNGAFWASGAVERPLLWLVLTTAHRAIESVMLCGVALAFDNSAFSQAARAFGRVLKAVVTPNKASAAENRDETSKLKIGSEGMRGTAGTTGFGVSFDRPVAAKAPASVTPQARPGGAPSRTQSLRADHQGRRPLSERNRQDSPYSVAASPSRRP